MDNKELIAQAFMAGQADAGIDPSYSSARIYAHQAIQSLQSAQYKCAVCKTQMPDGEIAPAWLCDKCSSASESLQSAEPVYGWVAGDVRDGRISNPDHVGWEAGINIPHDYPGNTEERPWYNAIKCYGETREEAVARRDAILSALSASEPPKAKQVKDITCECGRGPRETFGNVDPDTGVEFWTIANQCAQCFDDFPSAHKPPAEG